MSVRTALVTGANGGIGMAICAALRASGVKVLTLDVVPPCDLCLDIVKVPLPAEVFANIDICISNAGIVDTIAPAHSMTPEQWSRDIDSNLTGAFRVVQACLGGMRARGWGRIVAISSLAGAAGASGQVAYAASKAGLHGMIRTIAIENLGYGITANCVLPGMIATPKVLAMPKHIQERLLQALVIGRFGTPDEVASLVQFLTREESAYITAQKIVIDGGISLGTLSLGNPRPRETGKPL